MLAELDHKITALCLYVHYIWQNVLIPDHPLHGQYRALFSHEKIKGGC